MQLYFLNTRFDGVGYKQFNDEFVGNLSIIDILMFNEIGAVHDMLEEYELHNDIMDIISKMENKSNQNEFSISGRYKSYQINIFVFSVKVSHYGN